MCILKQAWKPLFMAMGVGVCFNLGNLLVFDVEYIVKILVYRELELFLKAKKDSWKAAWILF